MELPSLLCYISQRKELVVIIFNHQRVVVFDFEFRKGGFFRRKGWFLVGVSTDQEIKEFLKSHSVRLPRRGLVATPQAVPRKIVEFLGSEHMDKSWSEEPTEKGLRITIVLAPRNGSKHV